MGPPEKVDLPIPLHLSRLPPHLLPLHSPSPPPPLQPPPPLPPLTQLEQSTHTDSAHATENHNTVSTMAQSTPGTSFCLHSTHVHRNANSTPDSRPSQNLHPRLYRGSLDLLPYDVQIYIVEYMGHRELLALAKTCRHFRTFLGRRLPTARYTHLVIGGKGNPSIWSLLALLGQNQELIQLPRTLHIASLAPPTVPWFEEDDLWKSRSEVAYHYIRMMMESVIPGGNEDIRWIGLQKAWETLKSSLTGTIFYYPIDPGYETQNQYRTTVAAIYILINILPNLLKIGSHVSSHTTADNRSMGVPNRELVARSGQANRSRRWPDNQPHAWFPKYAMRGLMLQTLHNLSILQPNRQTPVQIKFSRTLDFHLPVSPGFVITHLHLGGCGINPNDFPGLDHKVVRRLNLSLPVFAFENNLGYLKCLKIFPEPQYKQDGNTLIFPRALEWIHLLTPFGRMQNTLRTVDLYFDGVENADAIINDLLTGLRKLKHLTLRHSTFSGFLMPNGEPNCTFQEAHSKILAWLPETLETLGFRDDPRPNLLENDVSIPLHRPDPKKFECTHLVLFIIWKAGQERFPKLRELINAKCWDWNLRGGLESWGIVFKDMREDGDVWEPPYY